MEPNGSYNHTHHHHMKEKTMTNQTTSPAASKGVFLIANLLPLPVLQSIHQFLKDVFAVKAPPAPAVEHFSSDVIEKVASRRQMIREDRLNAVTKPWPPEQSYFTADFAKAAIRRQAARENRLAQLSNRNELPPQSDSSALPTSQDIPLAQSYAAQTASLQAETATPAAPQSDHVVDQRPPEGVAVALACSSCGSPLMNETLAAAPEVAKGFSKNGVYHGFDRDMFINIGLHSAQAGINAAYTTAVERLMLSAFGDVTGQHLSSLATASAAPTEWREPLKQLGQLRLEAYALLHEEYLSMNHSLAERL
jgi:hypothetical protein